jgi:hypothetical protein
MALAHFVPEIWSGRVLSRLNDALVYRNVCTTEYEGEITGFGDVVKINEIGPVTVNSYSSTSTGALTVQQLADAQKLLTINQSKYYAFWLDDQDNAQTKPKLMRDYMDQAAFSLANNVDEYVAALYGQAAIAVGGNATTGVDVTSTNVLKYLSLAQQKLDEANTPAGGRWMVVPPWFAQKMTLSKIVLDTSNSATLGAGFLGRSYYGFDIYVSNNTYHASGTDRAAIMCGYNGSIALAVQLLATRQESSGTIGFKTLVKGLMVYGAKVIRPNNLGVLWADYTAEAT